MKTEIPATFPKRLKLVAWLNIAIQASFPIASVFTPIISSSQDNIRFLAKENALIDRQTQIYTLTEGENTLSVAKKYNMSVDALRKLNQFRTFAHDFDKLQAGDELDVPMAALPTIEWHAETKSEKSQNSQEQNIANFASQAGQFLSNNPSKDSASALARGMASATASSYLQQWFSQVGNSRIQLDVDESFVLKNSQVDLLIPLYDKKDKLLFTQGSLHRTDGRAQTNLGLGMRWFQPDYMLGANSFLDYDLSRSHSRMGLGIEYRRDYLKLAANSYHRLSNWKDSKDLEDYQERAANGWDIRSEAWLPSYPHVGAKLSYEQYYGDEVGLFGSDKRRTDPQALTVGLSYTPFPLLTINAERRRGTSDERDSKIGLQLNYQLGTAWQQQINPDNVAVLRTLQGSRYDFVDRNNNIVLEYRKKEVINLSVSSPITGYAGEEKSLIFTVNSKYGLDRIEWSAPQLIAANGQLIDNKKGQYRVKLPDYQVGKQATNSYIINAVAIDKQGNRSANTTVQVTVNQAAIFAGNSHVSPNNFTLAANGKAQQKITITIKDKNNQLIDVAANEISLRTTPATPQRIRAAMKKTSSATENPPVKVSEFTRVSTGQYSATITSGTKPESITLTPVVRDILLTSINVTLTADSQTAHLSELKLIKNGTTANGLAENQLKFKVIDALGYPLIAHPVKFEIAKPAKVAKHLETNEQGEIFLPITSTAAGETTLTINYGGSVKQTVPLTFIADQTTAKINSTDFKITPNTAIANGFEAINIATIITDANNNPVPSFTVNFDSDNGKLTEKTVKTDGKGIAKSSLTNTAAGKTLVTAIVGAKRFDKSVTFTSNKNSVQFKQPLQTSPSTPQLADGKAKFTVTAILVDANSNPLKNMAMTWQSNQNKVTTLSGSSNKTDDNGQASITVASTLAGENVITATVDGTAVKQDTKLNFIADKTTATIAASDLDIPNKNTFADGKTPKTITAKVTDLKGNILPNMDIEFMTTGGKFVGSKTDKTTTAKTAKDGTATVELTNTKAETVTVSAKINGKIANKTTTFIANVTNSQITTLQARNNNAIADGKAEIIFEAYVKDDQGNPIENATIDWSSDQNNRDVQFHNTGYKTDKNGFLTVSVTSYKATNVTVTGHLAGQKKPATAVTFIADKSTAQLSSFNTLPATIIANDADKVAIRTQVTDANNNPLKGIDVHFQAGTGNKMSPEISQSDQNGYVESMLTTSNISDVITISANINKETPITSTIKSIADSKTATVELQKVSTPVTVSNLGESSGVTLTAIVKDGKGHILKNMPVTWFHDKNELSTNITTTNEKGETFVILHGTQAGETTVTAKLHTGKESQQKIIFKAIAADEKRSLLTMEPSTITANNNAKAIATLTLLDKWDNPVTGQVVTWSSLNKKVKFSDQKELSAGIYQASITGDAIDIHTITAQSKTVQKQAEIGFVADSSTYHISKIDFNKLSTNADGISTIEVTAQVIDASHHNAGQGVAIGWRSDIGKPEQLISKTDNRGTAIVKIKSTQAGTGKVKVLLGDNEVESKDTITFTVGAISKRKSTVNLSSGIINAGSGETKLTVAAKDEQGNPLGSLASKIQLSDPANLITLKSAFREIKLGTYEAILSATKAQTTQLTLHINSQEIDEKPTLVIQPESKTAQIKGKIGATPASATVGKNVTYSVELEDKYHNSLKAGEVIFWSTNDGTIIKGSNQTLTNSHGESSIVVTRETVGDAKVTVSLGSNPSFKGIETSVPFTQSAIDVKKSTVRLAKSTINAGETTTLTVTLKDQYGNLLHGFAKEVTAKSNNTDVTIGSVTESSRGVYTMEVTSKKIAKAEISVQVSGNSLSDKENITVQGNATLWKISQVKVDNDILKAGDPTGVTYFATVVDEFDNVLPKITVAWHLEGKAEKYDLATITDTSGIAKVKVTSNTIGELVMTAALTKGKEFIANKVTVIQGDINPVNSTLASDKTEIGADNTEVMTLIVKAADNFNNPIKGATVTIESNSPNFMIKQPLIDNKDGSYQTTATSNKQGTYTLTAKVDGKAIKKLTVKSGAANPVLSFKNQDKSTVYSSKSYDEQIVVDGLPTGATPVWESSNTSVASVGNDGKVKLHKAGIVKITARIQGNGVYNSAQASYRLNIDRADPQLHIPQSALNATWGDIGDKQAQAIFNNRDTDSNKPPIKFSIDNTSIATIDEGNGKITQQRPNKNTAIITVKSAETDQFKADSKTVPYQLGKTRFNIKFADDIQKMTDNISQFELQNTQQNIPKHAKITWRSGNATAVKLKSDNSIEHLGKGQANLTMRIESNDYFEESSGSYTAKIYTKPTIGDTKIIYGNNGSTVEDPTYWMPVFTDDNVTVKWQNLSTTEYDRPSKATLLIKENGNTLDKIEKTSISNNNEISLPPKKDYYNKKITVQLILENDAITGLNTVEDFRRVNVEVTEGKAIKGIELYAHVEYVYTKNNYKASACKNPALFETDTRHVSLDFTNYLRIGSKKLLSPIKVKYRLSHIDGSMINNIEYPKSWETSTSGDFHYNDFNSKYAVKNDCYYSPHHGNANIDAIIEFNGTDSILQRSFHWGRR